MELRIRSPSWRESLDASLWKLDIPMELRSKAAGFCHAAVSTPSELEDLLCFEMITRVLLPMTEDPCSSEKLHLRFGHVKYLVLRDGQMVEGVNLFAVMFHRLFRWKQYVSRERPEGYYKLSSYFEQTAFDKMGDWLFRSSWTPDSLTFNFDFYDRGWCKTSPRDWQFQPQDWSYDVYMKKFLMLLWEQVQKGKDGRPRWRHAMQLLKKQKRDTDSLCLFAHSVGSLHCIDFEAWYRKIDEEMYRCLVAHEFNVY